MGRLMDEGRISVINTTKRHFGKEGTEFFCRFFLSLVLSFFFFQAEDGIRDHCVTGVQTCALPILFRESKRSVVLREWCHPAVSGYASNRNQRLDRAEGLHRAIDHAPDRDAPSRPRRDRKSVV